MSERTTLTVTEAAAELGITPGRVRQLCTSGALACERPGERIILIDRAALDAVRVRAKPGPAKGSRPTRAKKKRIPKKTQN